MVTFTDVHSTVLSCPKPLGTAKNSGMHICKWKPECSTYAHASRNMHYDLSEQHRLLALILGKLVCIITIMSKRNSRKLDDRLSHNYPFAFPQEKMHGSGLVPVMMRRVVVNDLPLNHDCACLVVIAKQMRNSTVNILKIVQDHLLADGQGILPCQ